ncbi:MAG TPA: hypothetical protein VNO22_06335 [Planctomycetota bacterium]|nr:hypothetical protein [Planctomycetota bacterium]
MYVYGSPETISYLDTLYPVDPQTLLRTNLLNALALLIVVSTAALLRISRSSGKDPAVHLIHDPFKVAIVFLAIGMPVKYLLEWPYVVGLLDYTLPGAIQYLGSLSGVAQIPLAVASTGKRRLTRWLLWGNLTLELAFGVAILSKLHILLTIIWTCLGFHFIRPNVHRLILTGVVLAIMYAFLLSPFVNFARSILNHPSAQNLAEVAETLGFYVYAGGETTPHALSGVQGWWSRLSYSNVQAFAMDQYDQGAAGWTFHRIPFVFLPRVFLHDKPIMTPGREFTYTLRGTEHSSTGLGFAAEAYWHGGWLAVFCVCGYVGLLFTVLGKICWHAVRSHRWLYTPAICKAILLGLRPDDWFVPAYIGGVLHVAVMTLVLHILFRRLVCTNIPSPRQRSRRLSHVNKPLALS